MDEVDLVGPLGGIDGTRWSTRWSSWAWSVRLVSVTGCVFDSQLRGVVCTSQPEG